MAAKKPSERAFKHQVFLGPDCGAGAKSYNAAIVAWRKGEVDEETRDFDTVHEAESWLTEGGNTVRRYFTPALTLIREGGGISGWALWDGSPRTGIVHQDGVLTSGKIHAARPCANGTEHKQFTKMREAKAWLEAGAVKGRVDEGPLDANCAHAGVVV